MTTIITAKLDTFAPLMDVGAGVDRLFKDIPGLETFQYRKSNDGTLRLELTISGGYRLPQSFREVPGIEVAYLSSVDTGVDL